MITNAALVAVVAKEIVVSAGEASRVCPVFPDPEAAAEYAARLTAAEVRRRAAKYSARLEINWRL